MNKVMLLKSGDACGLHAGINRRHATPLLLNSVAKAGYIKIKMSTMTSYQTPTEQGYYGSFGGAYIPEMLHPNVLELQQQYLEIMNEPAFQQANTAFFGRKAE
jgi:hypothetical protein